MSKVVFILGAGASCEAGAPTMQTFLDTAEDLYRHESITDPIVMADFELMLKGLYELRIVHSHVQFDRQNFESVFAAFEMAKLIGKLGSIGLKEINRLPTAMKNVISTTLEKSISFSRGSQGLLTPKPYNVFAKLIEEITKNSGSLPNQVSLITFNYDICLDWMLSSHGLQHEYCLEKEYNDKQIKLLKLHGSLNWTYCSECEKVIPWNMNDFFNSQKNSLMIERDTVFLDVSSRLHSFSHCNTVVASEPIIVPPTWNKAQYQNQLSKVWSTAASELSDADYIVVIGYSLPKADHFFRDLFGLGTTGETRIRKFIVVDPDKVVEGRFMSLLGPDVRNRFSFLPTTFEDVIDDIYGILNMQRYQAPTITL